VLLLLQHAEGWIGTRHAPLQQQQQQQQQWQHIICNAAWATAWMAQVVTALM
jgi:hypothetical protein